MKLLHLLSAFALSGSILCSPAAAQTRFCLGGDLDHLTQEQKSACSAKVQLLRGIATSLGAPEDWHFVVVCGEDGWKSYAAFSTSEEDAFADRIAVSDYQAHETFLRASRLDSLEAAQLRLIVSQELGAIGSQRHKSIASKTVPTSPTTKAVGL